MLIFTFLLCATAGAQTLLIRGQSGPTSFPFGKGPYGSIGGTTLTSGAVTVASGETLSLAGGTTYDFKSLTIAVGGTLRITGHGVAIVGSVGNIIINGSVVTDYAPATGNADCTKTLTATEIGNSTAYSFSYNFLVSALDGGNGAQGSPTNNNQGYSGYPGDSGRSQGGTSCGKGSGGGGGAGIDLSISFACPVCPPGSWCKMCMEPSAVCGATDGVSANLSTTNTTFVNGGNGITGNSSGASPGSGGGGAGGKGCFQYAGNYGGSGGGGGYHGGSASSLILKTRGSVGGSGTINLRGQTGYSGGNGGSGSGTYCGGGGGGGGGTGGFGGNLKILHKTGNAFPPGSIFVQGGLGGAKGLNGTNCPYGQFNGTAQDGSPGGNGTSTESTW